MTFSIHSILDVMHKWRKKDEKIEKKFERTPSFGRAWSERHIQSAELQKAEGYHECSRR